VDKKTKRKIKEDLEKLAIEMGCLLPIALRASGDGIVSYCLYLKVKMWVLQSPFLK
jgi:hypothetical protein